MKQRVTIRDVARRAGVSHQTVSRVINNKAEISPSTRARVLEAIRELNYRPSRTAQGLAKQRTQVVGFVVPNIANPYFAEVASGVQSLARQHEYNVFLGSTNWDPVEELRLLYSLADQPVDGIILCSSRCSENELRTFCNHFRPVVLSGRIFEQPGVSHVLRAYDESMQTMVGHLVAQGHTAIGMLAGPTTASTMSNALQVEGFRKALRFYGVPVNEAWIVPGPLTAEGGYQSALHLLTHHPQVTALCAHNDLVAIGAIHACREVGRTVPDDCAVIGYNDMDLAAKIYPPLTTLHVDTWEVGCRMMERLLDMIKHPDDDFPSITLPPNRLVVRESG